MEQQINEELKESTTATVPGTLNPSHVKNQHLILVLALLCLVGLGAFIFFTSQQSVMQGEQEHREEKSSGGDMQESAERTSSVWVAPIPDVIPIQIGDIAYNTGTPQILKTVVLPKDDGNMSSSVHIRDIGTITTGKFQNKKLGFAFKTWSDEEEISTSEYAYVVIDQSGTVIAWDKNFMHADEDCFLGRGAVCTYDVFSDIFNLKNIPEQSLAFLPKEFSVEGVFEGSDRTSQFDAYGYLDMRPMQGLSRFEGKTESGFTILRSKGYGVLSVSSQTQYWVEFPFGVTLQVSPKPNFFSEATGLPQVTWTSGTKEISAYNYGQYAYGWDDCYDNIGEAEFNAGLAVTGSTIHGDPIYEIDAQKFPNVYACLHEKTKRYDYNPVTDTGVYVDTISYADFIHTHPMFFWRHTVVGLLGMVRSDVVPAAEKAKPVVYLYPEKEERVHVSVLPVGGFTVTDPEYGNGWIVDATPEGRLTNVSDGKEYPYLFWEGGKEGVVETPKEGFVIARENIHTTLETTLTDLGLNDQERFDFLEFWVPKLSHAPYYFVTFIDRSEIDRVAPMRISPTPDTIIRVLMDYKPLVESIEVEPLHIEKVDRQGFVAVEWGGIVRD